MSEEKEKKLLGKVMNFFSKISVAAIELTDTLKVGDTISIEGSTTQLELTVESMQIDRDAVDEAKSGDSIGIKVDEKVRGGDKVYLLNT